MSLLVVADTTPLVALERVGLLGVLPALYGEVLAPGAVAEEFGEHPPWLRVVEIEGPPAALRLPATLDAGEAEAIVLAQGHPGCTLLMDEARGRRVAGRLGLVVVGTLGVLVRAKGAGLIPAVRPALEELLTAHEFRLSAGVIAQALREAGGEA